MIYNMLMMFSWVADYTTGLARRGKSAGSGDAVAHMGAHVKSGTEPFSAAANTLEQ